MTAVLVDSSRQFMALADPTRLRILNLLAVRELCVCHLVELLGELQPKVSRHLAMLRRAGLVTVRVEGPWRHYALPSDPGELAARLLGCVQQSVAGLDDLRADRRRLAALDAPIACS